MTHAYLDERDVLLELVELGLDADSHGLGRGHLCERLLELVQRAPDVVGLVLDGFGVDVGERALHPLRVLALERLDGLVELEVRLEVLYELVAQRVLRRLPLERLLLLVERVDRLDGRVQPRLDALRLLEVPRNVADVAEVAALADLKSQHQSNRIDK